MSVNARIKLKRDTTANWGKARGFIPLDGEVIIYTDYKQITKTIEGVTTTKNVPGIKIGNGNAYVQDLAFIDDELRDKLMEHIENQDIHVTLRDKDFWNNKLNMEDSHDMEHAELIDETLIFNRN